MLLTKLIFDQNLVPSYLLNKSYASLYFIAKDLAIEMQFFNSSSCRIFHTGEDQRSPHSDSRKFAPSPLPYQEKTPNKLPAPKFHGHYSH